jgi:tetratricopeptide (TPR) repeat protein
MKKYFLPTIFLTITLCCYWHFASASPPDVATMDRLHQEAKQAFMTGDYPTAIANWQAALKQARELNLKANMSKYLVNLGVVNYSLGEYQQALTYYQDVLAVDKELGDKSAESADLTNIGLAYYSLNQYPKAIAYYKQALQLQQSIADKAGQSNTLGNLAIVYNNLGQYSEALKASEQALVLHQEFADQVGMANDFGNLGMIYDNLGEYAKALSYYKQALTLAEALGDPNSVANNMGNMGTAYKNLAEYAKAEEHYQRALTFYKQLDDQLGVSRMLTNLGAVADSRSQYAQALEYYQQALVIQRQLDDKVAMIDNFTNLGVVHDNLGHYQKALDYHQQALTLAQELGEQRQIANSLFNLGVVHHHLGEFTKSSAQYEQALTLQRKISDKRGIANSLTHLGGAYSQLGQYPVALSNYMQALELQGEISDRAGMGNTLDHLGVLYDNMGQPEPALGYFIQALTVHREIQDKRGEATDLAHLGTIHAHRGSHAQALQAYQNALVIVREIKDKVGESVILSQLGTLYGNQADYAKALKYFQQALQLDQELGDKNAQGADLANVGLVQQQLAHLAEANTALTESVAILEQLGTDHRWYAQRGLAAVQAQLKQADMAIQQYKKALDTIESIRAGLTEKAAKYAYMQDKLYVYQEVINLLLHLHEQAPPAGYDRQALEIFERQQGRVFLEEMGKSGAKRFGGVPKELLEQEQALLEQREHLQADLEQEYHKSITAQNAVKIQTLTDKLAAVKHEQQTLQQSLQRQYPKYYALKYPQPTTVTQLQHEVLHPDEAMLIYNVMADKTILWVVNQEQFALFLVEMGEQDVTESVNYMREIILNRLPELVEEGQPLYQQLIPEDAQALLTEAHTVYIVPTGALYLLPFETLVSQVTEDEEAHYLIQDHAIVYLSSASVLKILRDARAQRQTLPKKQFLAIANPDYPPCQDEKKTRAVKKKAQSVNELRIKSYRDVIGAVCFPPLPETAQEAQTIANFFQHTGNILYLGDKARRSNVFALNENGQLRDYHYVLFAAHGLLPNEVDSLTQSALVLSHPQQEGFLTMADAFELQFNADFINLSACNTGGGKQVKGEGIVGLTRAFMYAGTSAIGVTLWSVESASAENLSTGIFANLKNGATPADAIRQIKLQMIAGEANEDYYNHPFYWAPFIIYGSGN